MVQRLQKTEKLATEDGYCILKKKKHLPGMTRDHPNLEKKYRQKIYVIRFPSNKDTA
jgi:hypothetical protein